MSLIADTGAIYACYDRSDAHPGPVALFPSTHEAAIRAAAVVGTYGGLPLGLTDATLVDHA